MAAASSNVRLSIALGLFGLLACTTPRPSFNNRSDAAVGATNALSPDGFGGAVEAGVSPVSATASVPDADAKPSSTEPSTGEVTKTSGSHSTAGNEPDESAPDESAPDESAPDESAPDESAPDESAETSSPTSADTTDTRDTSETDSTNPSATDVDRSDASSVDTSSETDECRTEDGFRRCGQDCIPATDCCEDSECPSEGSCSDGSCTCPDDMHVCDDACVSNDAVTSCGVSCSVCPAPVGGTATCDGTDCGGTCAEGSKLCLGECIDSELGCSGECPTNTRNCDGFCTDLDSVAACGPDCEACPTPSNATPKCVDDECDFDCASGYKKCDGACIPENSCCTTADCDGELTCSSNTCGCAEKQCGDQCVPTSGCCAGECEGDLECIAEACACPAGQKSCGGDQCAPTDGCCTSSECPGDLTCNNGSCACASDEKSCGDNLCVPDSGCCDDDDCTGDLVCTGAVCVCPAGEESCGGTACAPSTGCCEDGDCGSGRSCVSDQCVDDVPPQVVSITPEDSSEGIVSNQPFTVVFSERMNVASSSAVVVQPSESLNLTWDSTGTRLTIVATNGWDYGNGTAITFTLTVGTSAVDTTGNTLSPAVTSTFSTLRTITTTLDASTTAYFNMNAANPTVCTSGNLQVGEQTTAPAGEYRSYLEFDMGSLNAHSIVSAVFSIPQTTTDESFYNTSWVVLGQLAAGPIDASLKTRPATTVPFGEFVTSSSVATPSMDMTSYVRERWSANERSKHVFSMNYGNTPPNNVYATFACDGAQLEVTYLTP